MATGKEVAAKQGEVVTFGGVVMTAEQFRVVEHTIAPGLDRDEMELFFYECKRRGVHPLDRLIFPIKRNDNSESGGGSKKLTFQCSIDYFRAAAEDTGRYVGQDPVEYGPEKPLGEICPKTGAGHADLVPESATVTVLRRSTDGSIIRVQGAAFWKEYYPGEKMGFMWRKMPKAQLAKCAEALTIRKAFPRELGRLYANEEAVGAETEIPFAPKASTVRPAQPSLPPSASTPASQSSMEDPADTDHGGAPGSPAGSIAVTVPDEVKKLSEVKQKLYIEAVTMCEGDLDSADKLLREVSEFTGQSGRKQWIDFSKLSAVSDSWAGKTLGKLRERKS